VLNQYGLTTGIAPSGRDVNLAQPTRLGPGPCGLGLKKPTLKKAPSKKPTGPKTPVGQD